MFILLYTIKSVYDKNFIMKKYTRIDQTYFMTQLYSSMVGTTFSKKFKKRLFLFKTST